MTDYVFTPRSLHACLARAESDEWFANLPVPADGTWEVLSHKGGHAIFVVHRDDDQESPRIAVMDNGNGPFGDLPAGAVRVAVQRVVRAAIEAQRPPMHLPWNEYHYARFTAFFAVPDFYGAFRWVMETDRNVANRDTCFWKVTTSDDPTLLEEFHPNTERYRTALSDWSASVDEIGRRFRSIPKVASTVALAQSVDLEAISFRAVTKYRTYTQWREVLTPDQKRFFDLPADHAVKLRGPAGSGKTLTLELKLLSELYSARGAGMSPRILFATHSWAMAEQVDEALRSLDESGDLSEVDVLPLIAVAQMRLPSERSGGYELLGEDSLSGKQLQLEKIAASLAQFKKGDWLLYRNRVSPGFRQRVDAVSGSVENRALVWDLMNEFASVISANGIMPGVNAERRYLAIQRSAWMMPVADEIEGRVVLRLYSDYVEALSAVEMLTTDQLINDYLNFLETFAWNITRKKEGFDYIFVDELHLFGEQERLVLHYLTRSSDQYPRLVMALDPRQSPNEVYAGFAGSRPRSGESGEADRTLGRTDEVDLLVVHRFSPEILRLVRHINRSYPALDMGADWHLDLESVNSLAAAGAVPTVERHPNIAAEAQAVAAEAQALMAEQSGRVAILVLDPLLLEQFEDAAKAQGIPVSVLRGRDDVDQLRYVRRSIVLSAAEYVAGLQFPTVICAGFFDESVGNPNRGYQLRRVLSLLYLALSRAEARVRLHVNDERGGVPPVLASALSSGCAELVGDGK